MRNFDDIAEFYASIGDEMYRGAIAEAFASGVAVVKTTIAEDGTVANEIVRGFVIGPSEPSGADAAQTDRPCR